MCCGWATRVHWWSTCPGHHLYDKLWMIRCIFVSLDRCHVHAISLGYTRMCWHLSLALAFVMEMGDLEPFQGGDHVTAVDDTTRSYHSSGRLQFIQDPSERTLRSACAMLIWLCSLARTTCSLQHWGDSSCISQLCGYNRKVYLQTSRPEGWCQSNARKWRSGRNSLVVSVAWGRYCTPTTKKIRRTM